jgi:hypothetical protein
MLRMLWKPIPPPHEVTCLSSRLHGGTTWNGTLDTWFMMQCIGEGNRTTPLRKGACIFRIHPLGTTPVTSIESHPSEPALTMATPMLTLYTSKVSIQVCLKSLLMLTTYLDVSMGASCEPISISD